MSDKCFIEIDGKKYELPVKKGTVGPSVIDVRDLYKNTGHFTFDPGMVTKELFYIEDMKLKNYLKRVHF